MQISVVIHRNFKSQRRGFLGKKFKNILLAFVWVLIILMIRLFILDIYTITSSSMEPTLLPGDYMIVNKMRYGPRILNIKKLIFYRKVGFTRLSGFKQVKKKDVIVFNYPQYEYLSDSIYFIYGTTFIKRCYGAYGDTIRILRDSYKIGTPYNNTNLFPYDTSLHWNSDYYGPLYVPRKGDTILLTPSNVKHYHDVLLYENIGIQYRNDSVFNNGEYSARYQFKYNYYFMLGDNFYHSNDSRFWGLLPETHIIGKAVFVLFSLDPSEPWYRKFRWDRFLKRIR